MTGEQGQGPFISLIIPTLNGGKRFARLLEMLAVQSRPADEILVIDSGSTDTTLATVARFPVHLQQIAARDFDHGGTRTMAARQARGDILVFLTQDAIPADRFTLERLVEPLIRDPELGATYGRQLPHQDASPVSAHLRLFNYPEEDQYRCLEDRHRLGFKTIFISNSFAAYTRLALAQVGYFPDKLLFGEDSHTLARLLLGGRCVQYVSAACVYHSHNYSLMQDVRRYFDVGVFHASNWALLGQFGGPGGAGRRFVASEISFLLLRKHYIFVFLSFIRNGLKLAAYALGRRYTLLPRRVARLLSMHSQWWD